MLSTDKLTRTRCLANEDKDTAFNNAFAEATCPHVFEKGFLDELQNVPQNRLTTWW